VAQAVKHEVGHALLLLFGWQQLIGKLAYIGFMYDLSDTNGRKRYVTFLETQTI